MLTSLLLRRSAPPPSPRLPPAVQVQVPQELQRALRDAMRDAGIPAPAEGSREWEAALASLKGVWASKYNERAYVSTRKVRGWGAPRGAA